MQPGFAPQGLLDVKQTLQGCDRSCSATDPLPTLLQRLAAGEWFTSRVSAAGLFATAYPRCAAALKPELRQLFAQLCRDETPMVRRAAAQKLGGFAKTVEREYVQRELMSLFTDLTQDGACCAMQQTGAA